MEKSETCFIKNKKNHYEQLEKRKDTPLRSKGSKRLLIAVKKNWKIKKLRSRLLELKSVRMKKGKLSLTRTRNKAGLSKGEYFKMSSEMKLLKCVLGWQGRKKKATNWNSWSGHSGCRLTLTKETKTS